MTERLTHDEMMTHSASAIRKVARKGRIGTSLVTWDEIEALVCLVLAYGLAESGAARKEAA